MSNLNTPAAKWLARMFECGYCEECGGDACHHTAVPFLGNWFARCDYPSDDDGEHHPVVTAYRMIASEFPDYPLDTIPQDIPAWLTCHAWHNDVAPIWGDAGYAMNEPGIMLVIDFPRPEDRELGGGERFRVYRVNEDPDSIDMDDDFESDDWAATLAHLEKMRTRR